MRRERTGISLSSFKCNRHCLRIRNSPSWELLVPVVLVTGPDLKLVPIVDNSVREVNTLVSSGPLPDTKGANVTPKLIGISSGASPDLELGAIGVGSV